MIKKLNQFFHSLQCPLYCSYFPELKQTAWLNEGNSAASFCSQVAVLVPDMFFIFYLVKNHKIAKDSTITNAREKISTDLESLEFLKKKLGMLKKIKLIKSATDFY
jgi:hypothetical protein